MKKFALVISLMIVIFTFNAYAQGRMDPAERAKDLKTKLGLTDDQTTKIQKIFEDAQTEAMAQMSGDSDSRSARRTAMQAVMTKAQEKVKVLLTDEQKTAYQKIIDERQNMRKMQK